MKWNDDVNKVAYDELYLDDVMKVHNYLFRTLGKVEEYNIFSMIDEYMRHSKIRKNMDCGNWSALNKSGKQLYNSINFSVCSSRNPFETGEQLDEIVLGWLADIYVLLQWRYCLSSDVISKKIPSRTLCRLYNPLHETSLTNAVEKLYHKYILKESEA